MGHTHHWTIKKTLPISVWKKEFEPVAAAILLEATSQGIVLTFESDSHKPPLLNRYQFRFNGYGENGCETFRLQRVLGEYGDAGDSCKTAVRPYDKVVLATLLFAATQFPAYLTVTCSDIDRATANQSLEFLTAVLRRCRMDADDIDTAVTKCRVLARQLINRTG